MQGMLCTAELPLISRKEFCSVKSVRCLGTQLTSLYTILLGGEITGASW
jgi:hypothetical protein